MGESNLCNCTWNLLKFSLQVDVWFKKSFKALNKDVHVWYKHTYSHAPAHIYTESRLPTLWVSLRNWVLSLKMSMTAFEGHSSCFVLVIWTPIWQIVLPVCNNGCDHTHRRGLFVSGSTQASCGIQGNTNCWEIIFNGFKSIIDALQYVQESSQ